MAFRHYVETFTGWVCPNDDDDDQWIAHNLSQYGVPPSVVVEIAISCPHNVVSLWAGVRKTNSNLDRRIFIEESEGAGEHLYTVLVQADASGYIEYYAHHYDSSFPSDVAPNFYIVGWWVGCNYVEKFENFAPTAPSGWESYALNQYGTSGNQIVDITMLNDSPDTGHEMGVRVSGSAIERKVRIKEAEAGGKTCLTLLTLASGDTGAVDLYTGSITECLFYLMGYFTTPPGNYVEQFSLFSNPTIDNEWQSLDIGASGIPNDAIVQFIIGHFWSNDDNQLGVRQTSSTLERILNLDEAETDGTTPGGNWGSMCSRTDSSGYLEYMSADVSDDPDFIAAGYWTNFTNSDEGFPYVGSIDCFIEGLPCAQCDLYISGPDELTVSGNLFLKVPEPSFVSCDLFISGIPGFISTSGQYPSGIPLYIHGAQLADINLYIYGNDQSESSGNLYVRGANICRTDADFSIDYPSGLLCYTQGSGIIPESGQRSFVVCGFNTYQSSGSLFINGYNPQSGSNDLFVDGHNAFNTSGNYPSGLPLNIGDGHEISYGSGSLFLMGPIPYSGEIYLYIQAGAFESLDLFISAPYSGSVSAYIKGPEFICSSGSFTYPYNIEDFIYPYGDPSPDLSIYGYLGCNRSCTLLIGPPYMETSWTFYLKAESDSINNAANLFTQASASGVNQQFSNISLYLEAADVDYPYTAGGIESWTMFLKAPSGNLTNDNIWTMFLKADFTTPATCNLYTYGHASGENPHGNEINDSINLVCSVNPDDPSRIGFIPFNSDPWTLFLKCDPGQFRMVDLYISGSAPIHLGGSGDLFIKGLFGQETGIMPLYLMGVSGIINNGPSGLSLFIGALNVYNIHRKLYTHGY